MYCKDMNNKTRLAMHGNGACYGNIITNSKEAFEKWYRKGIRVFEVDIAKTADDDFVAISHYVNKQALITRQIFAFPKEQSSYTKTWFKSLKLYKFTSPGLTPLSLEDIFLLMEKYPDVYIILDTFGLFVLHDMEELREKIDTYVLSDEIRKRIFVEVYNDEMFTGLGGYTTDLTIIYCLRYLHDGIEVYIQKTVEELRNMGIALISYPYKYIQSYQDVKYYLNGGIDIVSYSADNNHFEEMQDIGISINIVDNIYSRPFVGIKRYIFHVQNFIYRAFAGVVRRAIKIM